MKGISSKLNRGYRALASVVALCAMALVCAPAYAQVTIPPVTGYAPGAIVDAAGGEVGPLMGKVLLVALSLIVIVFAFRKVRRFVTGGA